MKRELFPLRTALFVPGNRPERVDKAVASGADAVIIDLEDAVPKFQKVETRAIVRKKVEEHGDTSIIIVRVNSLDSGYFEDDIKEILSIRLSSIMVPKVEEASHIHEINEAMLSVEKGIGITTGYIPIIPLIESAKGVQNIHEIVSMNTDPPRVFTVAFGAADYTLDLGIEMTEEGTELIYPRSRLAIACRSAGIDPPLDTPFMIDFKNIELLKIDAGRAKILGFQGKMCIHPNQVEPCNAIFSPTPKEIEWANKIISAFDEAEAKGIAAIQVEGKFVDYPIVERCRRILRLAQAIGVKS